MSLPVGVVLESLGPILAYPREGYRAHVADCRRLLQDVDEEAFAAMAAFCYATDDLSQTELEELYTRTFDLNPVG